jgi:hypothetical protein
MVTILQMWIFRRGGESLTVWGSLMTTPARISLTGGAGRPSGMFLSLIGCYALCNGDAAHYVEWQRAEHFVLGHAQAEPGLPIAKGAAFDDAEMFGPLAVDSHREDESAAAYVVQVGAPAAINEGEAVDVIAVGGVLGIHGAATCDLGDRGGLSHLRQNEHIRRGRQWQAAWT